MSGVSQSGQESNDTEWDFEADTVFVPFLFVSQSFDEEALVGFDFFVGPFFEGVGGSGSFMGVVNGLVFGA